MKLNFIDLFVVGMILEKSNTLTWKSYKNMGGLVNYIERDGGGLWDDYRGEVGNWGYCRFG